MRLPRLILLLTAALTLPGCAFIYSHEPHKRYHRIRVSNIEGKLIGEWIAEGYVSKTEIGYKFNAVQRTSGPPFPQEIHYPYRRQMEVGGQVIVVSRCGEPDWLYRLEGK